MTIGKHQPSYDIENPMKCEDDAKIVDNEEVEEVPTVAAELYDVELKPDPSHKALSAPSSGTQHACSKGECRTSRFCTPACWRFHHGIYSRYARNAILSFVAVNAIGAAFSINAILSIASVNSMLSIASLDSFMSIASAGSAFSIGCHAASFSICVGQ